MSASANLGRIAVMGAGAVGCYYGGMFARAGHDVTLIARAQHAEAVRRSGLRLHTTTFDASVPVRATEDPSAARGAKLVLFGVKSPDTERADAALAPHLELSADDVAAFDKSLHSSTPSRPRVHRQRPPDHDHP